MKTVFSKDNLPLIYKTVHGEGEARDYWNLTRGMQDSSGLTHQPTLELLLLRRGAFGGDVWSMCELARYCYRMSTAVKDDKGVSGAFFAEALSWWVKAARLQDSGALFDLNNYNILDGIKAYRSGQGTYADIEMICAMLTEYHFTDLGRTAWSSLTYEERERRVQTLVNACSPLWGIKQFPVYFIHELSQNGQIIDGLACREGKVEIRKELLDRHERLIEVLFHESGHIIEFAMENPSLAERGDLKALYGITDARMKQWYLPSDETPNPLEKDADTLSYGVYTAWAILFA